MSIEPAYLDLYRAGLLAERVATATRLLSCCTLCPRECQIDRLSGELGRCRTGRLAMVSNYGPHFGEERPLSGSHGSGTIFFTRCNLHCVFCQNHDISQTSFGEELEPVEIARLMLRLQEYGCHNINFVSPTHIVPQLLAALEIAAENGLRLPLVYNSGGYDALPTLQLLDGIIDIYMPDMKYSDPASALRYSKIADYPQVNQTAVREMHRQVGNLVLNESGLAVRGLLIRHLILPNDAAGSQALLDFIAREISTSTYLNLMDQYRPDYHAIRHPELNRRITSDEHQWVVRYARQVGLTRLD